MKLSQIKAELKKMLLQMSVVKTDKAVLSYEGEELTVETEVWIEDEDGNRTEVENGEYLTEDGKTLVVEGGKVADILEPKEEEVTEEPAEEVQPEEEVAAEEEQPEEEQPKEEEPAATEEETAEPEAEEDTKVAELEAKIAELEAQLADALAKIAELTDTTEAMFSNIQKMSMAKPAAQEFENIKKQNKTGNAKLDKFLARLNG